MRRRWVAAALAAGVLTVGLLARPRHNRWPITNAHPTGTRIIAFGDSLTSGYGAGPGESYPEHLARLLGRPVLNRGVSGNTTADGRARLEQDVLSEDPRVVLLCLGGNDMLRRQSAEEQFANLRAMVKEIQARGALVILIGTEGFLLAGPVDYGERYRTLAEETGCVYVPDIMDGILSDRSLMRDSIHPNGAGNEKIARRLMAEVGNYLRR